MRYHTCVYEINSRPFIGRLSRKYHQALTLATVPEEEWRLLKARGFDFVWLMGIWQRSPGARQRALLDPSLRQDYDRILPGWTGKDVLGSPYAVYFYRLDRALGKRGDLALLKCKVNNCGLGLIVDFVPNHLALDHQWTASHPNWFVQGSGPHVRAHPDWFFVRNNGVCLAHGRDPNFPPWTDTVQLNFFSIDLRKALVDQLLKIAKVADGVRCDMAMLALNDIFEQVWGNIVEGYPRHETEFWTEAIGRVKQERRDFLFIAEAYWGLERKLQNIGFDFTYDKLLYDKLRFSAPTEIQTHLSQNDIYHPCSVHFIENHDEARAISAFGRERSLAAAVVVATIPGLCLLHDGQLEGRHIHLPVQLLRMPEETQDPEIVRFYERLLAACNVPALHEGEWTLLEPAQPWEGNTSHHNLLAWVWQYGKMLRTVIVNYSPVQSQALLRIPLPSEVPERIAFQDELTGETYIRDSMEVSSRGLYIDLGPYKSHFLNMAGC